ncbi:MAG: response regulator [Rhodospirillaceae bacterium]|nr:response regulator [Rhodospirillaceae bacterium]
MNRPHISARLVALMAISVIVLVLAAVGTTILVLRVNLNESFATASAERWAATAAKELLDRPDPSVLKLSEAEERALLNVLSPGGIVDYRILDADGRVVRTNRTETIGAVLTHTLQTQIAEAGTLAFLIDPLRNRPLQGGQAEGYAVLKRDNTVLGYVGIRLDRAEAGQDIFKFAEVGLIVFAVVILVIGVPAVVVLYRHLDARGVLEQDLKRRTDDLMRAEEIANVGHWMLKRDTEVYEWSPEMYRIYGVNPDTFTPSSAAVLSRCHPKDRQKASAASLEAIKTRQTVRQDFRIKRPTGEIRHTENFIDCIFDKNGIGVGYFGVTRDVTDRVQQEMELRAARDSLQTQANELTSMARELESAIEKSERANTAKGDFLAIMSHELRTPMTGILGMADLLRLSGLSRDQEQLAENLIVSAHSLLDLLNDILDFSKIEAGKIEIEHVHFSLHRLIMALQRLFDPAIREKGNQLTVEIEPGTVDMVIGDPKRFNQILANLVSNANKFTERGSIFVIVSSRPQPDGTHAIQVKVRDTGIGMSMVDQQSLFKPFTQADTSTSRRYGGTGLGLSICKRLLDAMDGEISVSSAKGEGSTFIVRLALPPGDAAQAVDRSLAAAPQIQNNGAQQRRLRILIAEDNDINRALFQKMLERLGHRAETAVNGKEAIDLALHNVFDIILMDIQMPVMDGLQATATLRAKSGPFGRLPIVGLTADAMISHHKAYLDAGMNAIVTKPVDWQRLAAVMADLTGFAPLSGAEPANDAPAPERVSTAPTDPRPPASDVIDVTTISDMLKVLPREIVTSLFERFIEQLDTYLANIHNARAQGDLGKVRSAAHTLRGISAQFGANGVAELAKAIEEKDADLATISETAQTLTGIAAQTKDAGRKLLNELQG